MKCEFCGGEFEKKSGEYTAKDNFIGNYAVDLDCWYECDTCGENLFPYKEALKLDEARKEKQFAAAL